MIVRNANHSNMFLPRFPTYWPMMYPIDFLVANARGKRHEVVHRAENRVADTDPQQRGSQPNAAAAVIGPAIGAPPAILE